MMVPDFISVYFRKFRKLFVTLSLRNGMNTYLYIMKKPLLTLMAILALGAPCLRMQAAEQQTEERLGTTEELWITNGNRKIYGELFTPQGDCKGVAIVSHGFNGNHSFGRNYYDLMQELGYKCYIFDFPCGSTKSLSDNNTLNMSIPDEQSDLQAIVSHFKQQAPNQEIVLIGESQGGLISALTAATMKDDISRLILVFPALCIPDNWRDRYPHLSDIPEVTDLWGVKLGRRFFEEIHDMKPLDMIGAYEGPVLIVQGDQDRIVSMEDSEKAVDIYNDARLHVIAGAGHGFNPKEREELKDQIRLFFDGPAEAERVIRNGVPWFDTDGNIVNAHGACIVEDGGRYWLFGEYKSDESNAFPGFGCYSSPDLVNWKFERVVLPVQPDGILGPERVGERVKVMRCPSTGEYVMLMHADDMKYKDPNIAIAVCDRIDGDYRLLGTIEYDGEPIKRWDMGTFQDEDGTGYLLIHHGPIYRLSPDYRSIEAKVADIKGMGESPAMFRKDDTYYLLTSHTTSWERNDNYYYTAPSPEGPWEHQGLFCPEGSLTYNSQCTFVFPLKKDGDIIPMYMGDRWSFPHQASAATYVWMPIQVDGTRLSIPEYWNAWNIDTITESEQKGTATPCGWTSNTPGDKLTVPFKGKRISVVGKSNNRSGYAWIRIKNSSGDVMHSSLVDFYSKVEDEGTRFVSKTYPEGEYVLEVEVAGENPVWFNKRGDRFGSTDLFVNVAETIAE